MIASLCTCIHQVTSLVCSCFDLTCFHRTPNVWRRISSSNPNTAVYACPRELASRPSTTIPSEKQEFKSYIPCEMNSRLCVLIVLVPFLPAASSAIWSRTNCRVTSLDRSVIVFPLAFRPSPLRRRAMVESRILTGRVSYLDWQDHLVELDTSTSATRKKKIKTIGILQKTLNVTNDIRIKKNFD